MKTTLRLLLLLLLAFGAAAQTDSDNDGVDDSVDACVGEDSSLFDIDGDGCLDSFRNMRHIEYWDLVDLPFSYVVHEDGAFGIGDGSDLSAIQDAFASWSAADNLLAATYGGTTADAETDGMNGIHEVSFEDSEFVALFGSAVIAVGLTTSFDAPSSFMGQSVRPGQIVDADILFNPLRSFQTDTAGSGIDLPSVAVHECGHIYGLTHSAIPNTSLYPAIPSGTLGRTLELDDRLAAFMAAPLATALATANVMEGSLIDGADNLPLGGAIIFLLDAGTEEQVAATYTFPDGSWRFVGLPAGDYFVYAHPLDGSAGANGLTPAIINEIVESVGGKPFVPEYWDDAESANDDSDARTAITVAAGAPIPSVDIISNVDATPPALAEVEPNTGDTDVLSNTVVLIGFDEALDFDSAVAAFRLEDTATNSGVAGTLSLLQDGKVLVFYPRSRLLYLTEYEVILSTSLTDIYGNAISTEIRSSFTTEAAPPLAIEAAAPNFIVAGSTVAITGQGFDAANASAHEVFFGGLSATPSYASANHVVVTVPTTIPENAPVDVFVRLNGEDSNTLVLQSIIPQEIARGTPDGESSFAGVPRRMAMLPDANFGYVAHGGGVAAVTLAPAQADYRSVTEIPINGGAYDVAVHPDGRRVYAISKDASRFIAINSDYVDLDARDPQFNTLLDDKLVVGTPRAIAIHPDGTRAALVMNDGTVQIWDLQIGSATFHRQIAEITTSAATLAATVTFDRVGSYLLLGDSSGGLLVHSASDYSEIYRSTTPADIRDIVLDPVGTLVHVTHSSGQISVLSLTTGNLLATITEPGDFRGMAITPAGTLGYVANRSGGTVDVVDLNPASAGFRLIGTNFPLPGDPVDVTVSPNGLYVYALEQQSQNLQVFGVGFGPVLFGVSPPMVQPGNIVRVWAEGLAGFDQDWSVGSASNSQVLFDGVAVQPRHSTGSETWVTVPGDYDGGLIQVDFTGAVLQGVPLNPRSNPLPLPLLPEQPLIITGGVTLDADGGHPTGIAPFTIGAGAIAEDSSIGVYATYGRELVIFDADPSSPNFLQRLAIYDYSGETAGGTAAYKMIISPRNNAIFLAYFFDTMITVIDGDRHSPTFGQKLSNVDFSSVVTCYSAGAMDITPDGERLVIADDCNDRLLIARPVAEPFKNYYDYEVITVSSGIGYCEEVLIHPDGTWAFAVANTDLIVMDINPFSTNYGQVASHAVLGSVSSMALAQDGYELLMTSHTGAGSSMFIDGEDVLTNAWNPSTTRRFDVENPTSGDESRISVTPDGRFALVDRLNGQIYGVDVENETVVGNTPHRGDPNMHSGMAWWPDGSLLLLVPGDGVAPLVFSRDAGQKLNEISGHTQTGIAGQPLPAPISLFIHDGTSTPVANTPVELRVTSGDGVLGNGRSYQVLMTDEAGRVSFDWTLGPTPDPDSITRNNRVSVTLQDGSVVSSTSIRSIADPDAEPISLSSVLPSDLSTGTSVTTNVQAIFSRAVELGTIDATNFEVSGPAGPVDGSFGFADGNRRVSFLPTQPLGYSTSYQITLGTGIGDLSGNPLGSASVTSFTTQEPPALSISAISPPAATAGSEVVIAGVGFDATPAGNVVSFGGVEAEAHASTPTSIRVYVPLGAGGGALHVNALAQQSNDLQFVLLVPTTSPIDELLGIVDTGATIHNVAITPDGAYAYSVSTDDDQVLPVDLETLEALAPIAVGDAPVAIVINAAGTLAYTANYGGNSVSVIDLSSQFVVGTIDVGDSPVDLVLAPAGDRLYVVNSLDQTLSVIDTNLQSASYHTVVATSPTGATTKGAAITPDGGKLYLGTNDGYLIIDLDPASFGVVASVPTGSTTKGAAITPDGGLLILVTAAGDVLVIDISPGGNNAVVATVPTGSTTKGAAITPDGGLLYIIPEDESAVLVVQIENLGSVSKTGDNLGASVQLTILGTIDAGDDPTVLVFDPSGSGLAVALSGANGKLTVLAQDPPGIAVEVEVDPRPIFDPQLGRWIRACMNFPAERDPKDVDLSCVLMNGVIPTEAELSYFDDCDGDGELELVLLFDRELFQDLIPSGPAVDIRITGCFLSDGATWFADDVVRTERPVLLTPLCGAVYSPGDKMLISWTPPAGVATYIVHIYYTVDDGMTWTPIVLGVADEGYYSWTVPYLITTTLRVMVIGVDKNLEVYGETMLNCRNEVAEGVVPVVMSPVEGSIEDGAGVLRWTTTGGSGSLDFAVLRGSSPEGPFEAMPNRPSRNVTKAGETAFEFRDAGIEGNRSYWYKLVESGSSIQHGPYELRWSLANDLLPNRPNPFNPRTTIRFSLAQAGHARLAVYDVRGRLVRVLLDTDLRAKEYEVVWDGRDGGGGEVSSGIYLYKLSVPGFSETKKMTLVR